MKLIAYLFLKLFIVRLEATPNPGVWGTQRHVCNPIVETLTPSHEYETLVSLTTRVTGLKSGCNVQLDVLIHISKFWTYWASGI